MSKPLFGYDKFGNPIELQLEALIIVEDLLSNEAISFREASEYLYDLCGRRLSHVGLRERLAKGVHSNNELQSL